MIRQLCGDTVTVSSDCPVEGRIEAYYRAYGTGYDFCRFYTGDNVLAMLYCGELFVKAYHGADMEELGYFIDTVPHFSLIAAGFQPDGAEPLLHMRGSFEQSGNADCITEDYSAVYEVLSDAFGITDESDFGRWYTDTCHRVRHNVSRLLLICDNGMPAATATVLYDNRYGAFLSHIGVKRRLWGKGCGRRIVSKAAEIYGNISLLCEQDKQEFYEKCGLTCRGTVYKVLRNGDGK
ncbi:MAG: GNAT family N-acetyltransferase [Eubacterium sp.]|nr:GNAT family N-acetyltransferase [Eubacterium sp.]